jgi:DNA-binding NarL/FixJ family response regulator
MILIVDDSTLVTKRIIEMLRGVENSRSIMHQRTFAKAATSLEHIKFSVVILDINLPDKSGIALLNIIKKRSPQTIVIVFTNENADNYKSVCKKSGADYFIDKSREFEMIPKIINSLKQSNDYFLSTASQRSLFLKAKVHPNPVSIVDTSLRK